MSDNIRLNVSLEPQLHERLRLLSVKEKKPLTQLVPILLREALTARETYPTGGTPALGLCDADR